MYEDFKNYLKDRQVELTLDIEKMIDESLERRFLKRNEVLIHQGEISYNVFFVVRGLLRTYVVDSSGKQHILFFVTEGKFHYDRSSIVFQGSSNHYLEAVEESEFIIVDVDFFYKLEEMSISFQKFNALSLNRLIYRLNERIYMLIATSAEERYLHFLKLHPTLSQRVPQWMIASYLGITPESLSRVRKDLVKKSIRK